MNSQEVWHLTHLHSVSDLSGQDREQLQVQDLCLKREMGFVDENTNAINGQGVKEFLAKTVIREDGAQAVSFGVTSLHYSV